MYSMKASRSPPHSHELHHIPVHENSSACALQSSVQCQFRDGDISLKRKFATTNFCMARTVTEAFMMSITFSPDIVVVKIVENSFKLCRESVTPRRVESA